jgi:hypothetical protein
MAMSLAMTVRGKNGNESGDDGEDEGLAMSVAMKVRVEDDNECGDDGEG